MRLIDADYLKTWFGEKDLYAYDYIVGTINDAPTIKPEAKLLAEVKLTKEELQELVGEAEKKIRAEMAHPEPHWIPCGERLPEEDGEYLVTFEKGYAEDYGFDFVGIAPYEVDCEGFGIWQENFDLHTLGSLGSEWADINVIAWMPRPEPYQPKEESE